MTSRQNLNEKEETIVDLKKSFNKPLVKNSTRIITNKQQTQNKENIKENTETVAPI